MFCAIVGVQAERHFQLVNRFGRYAVVEDLMTSFECIVITLETLDAFLDGKAGALCFREIAHSSQGREIMQG